METVQNWAHENIEGAENDEIEATWQGSVMSIYINGELVKETDYHTAPDSAELRLSYEIDAVNYYYAYGN